MKIIGIEHIGIASDDLSKANKFWSLVLGIKNTCTEDIDNQGVITDIYDTGNGKIELLLRADIKQYVGHHDVVSGIIQGADDEQDEVWAIAHSGEPGAADNASGVVVTLEIARLLESLIESGEIKRPRRSIRLVNAY